MSLTRQDIEKVALLGRLRLSAAETGSITEQLGRILAYVDQLADVNTDGVEPMAHAIELRNVFRGDELAGSLPRALALASAPHHDERGYLVPAVLGD